MSGVAAPSSLVFRRRSTRATVALDASLEIGAGGEARVFAVPGDERLVAKIYHQPTAERARKVALMVDEPPRIDDPHAALAWPADLLLGEGGRFAGFVMPRAAGPRLFELYNPITRRKRGALCDHAILHRAGARLAAAFDALHARGYVVGDVNESNVLLAPGGVVTLVDTDSFQVRDPEDGTIHRSKVGKAEFTPPELQGKTFGDFDRTPEHDRFGLGVLLFLALMEGTHPFAGRMDTRAETPPVEERIRRGLFAHHGHREIDPPKLAPPFAVLDPEIRALFVHCFVDGHADPAARPAAAEWKEALAGAARRLKSCEANARHRFGAHLDACPWCARTALLHGRDPFPANPFRAARDGKQPARRASAPARPAPVRAVHPAIAPAPPAFHHPPPLVEIDERNLWGALIAASGLFFAPAFLALAPVGIMVVGLCIYMVLLVRALTRGFAFESVAAIPHMALPSRPFPRLRAGAPDAYRLRIATPLAREVDLPPVLHNRDELERMLAPHRPPAGMHPVDWSLRVAVWVREDGTVNPAHVHALESPPPGPAVDAVAAAVVRARFEPLFRQGRPVSAWVWFDVLFER